MMKAVTQALMVAFEFCGQKMSDDVLTEMAKELAIYPEQDVLHALKRCRTELKTIKFTDILQRIPGLHPGFEEAWAMVSPKVRSDAPYVFMTDPMREAYGAALALEPDMVAARMAFKEVYTQAVGRAGNGKPKWDLIPGTDKSTKELALKEAVKKGIADARWAMAHLPHEAHDSLVQLANQTEMKRIA